MTDDSIIISNGPTDDNPAYTPATDDIGGVHYQKVKLIDSTADSTAPIGVAANPLHIQGTVTASGGATAANQTTEIASLATIASAIKTEDAGAVTGDKGIPALAYVNTNAAVLTSNEGDYGNFSINSTGAQHVDINSDFRQSAGKSILKQEDVASASGDAGVFVLTIKQSNSPSVLSDTAGDYQGIGTNDYGAVYVDINANHRTNGAASILKLEDTAHASGDAGVMSLAVRNDTGSTTFSDANGDYTPIAVRSNGQVFVATYPSDSNSPVRFADNAFGSGQGVMVAGARRADTATSGTATNARTTELISDANGKLWTNSECSGGVAHDGVDSGNPVKIGLRARTTNITAVASDDRVDSIGDKQGRTIVQNSIPEERFTGRNGTLITNTTSTQLIAGAASVRYVITAITVSNMSATVSTEVNILDGATVVWSGPATVNGGGYSITFPDGLLCTANTAINAQCVTTGASVRANVAGHKIS